MTTIPPYAIAAARVLAGLSQQELAAAAKVGRVTVQRVENPAMGVESREKSIADVLAGLGTRGVSIRTDEHGNLILRLAADHRR